MSRIIILIPVLTVCALLYLQVKTIIDSRTIHLIEEPVPYFDLPEMTVFSPTEKRISNENLMDLHDGDIMMVNFFASWCSTCFIEHDQVLKLANDYKLKIIGVAYKDPPSDIHKYMNKYGNPYAHIALDEKGYAAAGWRITGTPETFFIDNSGIIRYRYRGPIRKDDLTEKILPILEAIRKDTQQGGQS